MYTYHHHKRNNGTKVRLSEPVEEIVEHCAATAGLQKAVWLRAVIEQYLIDQGYEIPHEDTARRLRRA